VKCQTVESCCFITWEKSRNRGRIRPVPTNIPISYCLQWGPKGIRVNSLCPGYMKTDLIIDLLAKEGRHIEEGWVKDVPMGRLGRPHELQGTIVWMASDASSYLNGSDIVRAVHRNFQFESSVTDRCQGRGRRVLLLVRPFPMNAQTSSKTSDR
jgi:hypothetical protein